jgi:MFS family permease
MKKIFDFPKEIYVFFIVDFILGLELMGTVLLIFFKDWGGLTQTQTQMLQSWFTLCIFVLEIPTGLYGDVRGKKKSVLLGYGLVALGVVTYCITPNLYLFLLSEFIFALGVACISGAEDAWRYDICQKYHIEERFRELSVTSEILNMIGMILAAGAYTFICKYLSVQQIFLSAMIPNVIAVILLGIFVKGTDTHQETHLKPDYLKTAKEALKVLKSNSNLKKLVIYTGLLASTSYFVIWLYQEALRVLSVPENMFGAYRMVLLISEIIAVKIAERLLKKISLRKMLTFIACIVALGFILGGVLHNIVGTIFVLAFAGGLGLQISCLISNEINAEIPQAQRATVLSFVGMARRLMLTVFNPVIGLLVDTKGVFFAFLVLGIVSLLAIFFKPKIYVKNVFGE